MRLIKQYRDDVGTLAGKLAIAGAALGSILLLGVAVVSILNSSPVTSDNWNHDVALLGALHDSETGTPVEGRIAKHEQLIGLLHDKAVLREANRELAALYETQGRGNLVSHNFSEAEESFQTATTLDPGNSTYLSDMAQLYADAALQQSEEEQRLQFLKNSTTYYADAIDRESDSKRKRQLFDQAAGASYTLAKEELKIPAKKLDGIADLQKAKQLATPGSPIARDVSEMMFLVHN